MPHINDVARVFNKVNVKYVLWTALASLFILELYQKLVHRSEFDCMREPGHAKLESINNLQI